MRALVFCFAAACAPIERVAVAPAVATTITSSQPAPSGPLMCAPIRPSDGENDTAADAVFFGKCETFAPIFYDAVADACEHAMPALSEALRAVANDRVLLPLPRGGDEWSPRDRKSFTLFQASRAFVPPRCTSDFTPEKFATDDYGRSVADVTHLWRDVPACRPDGEMFSLRTITSQRGEQFEQSDIDIGVYMFAMAIGPHLTSMGTMYLRKYLMCDELDHRPTPSDDSHS